MVFNLRSSLDKYVIFLTLNIVFNLFNFVDMKFKVVPFLLYTWQH